MTTPALDPADALRLHQSAETAADAKITVAFCCEKCKAEFDKDPKKHIAKVK